MAIRVGSTNITDIRYGATSIKQVKVGSTVVWRRSFTSNNFPGEYGQSFSWSGQWMTSTNNPYIARMYASSYHTGHANYPTNMWQLNLGSDWVTEWYSMDTASMDMIVDWKGQLLAGNFYCRGSRMDHETWTWPQNITIRGSNDRTNWTNLYSSGVSGSEWYITLNQGYYRYHYLYFQCGRTSGGYNGVCVSWGAKFYNATFIPD